MVSKKIYYLMLFVITAIWGSSFLVIKDSLNSITLWNFLYYRCIFAGGFGLLLYLLLYKKIYFQRETLIGFVLGTLLFLVLLLTNLGLQYSSSSKVALYTGLSATIVSIVEYFSNKTNKSILFYGLLSVLGIIFFSMRSSYFFDVGDLIGILLSVVISLQIIFSEKLIVNMDALKIGLVQIVTCALLSLFVIVIFKSNFLSSFIEQGGYIFHNYHNSLVCILYTALFSTLLCFVGQTICLKQVSGAKAAIIFNFEPVVAIVCTVVFSSRSEQIGLFQVIGICFILISLFGPQVFSLLKQKLFRFDFIRQVSMKSSKT